MQFTKAIPHNMAQAVPNALINGGNFPVFFDQRNSVGIFRCRQQTLWCFILVRPQVDIDPKGEIEVVEGGSAFLVCNASGTPYPEIRWWMLPLNNYISRYQGRNLQMLEAPVTVSLPNNPFYPLFNGQRTTTHTNSNKLVLVPAHEIALKYNKGE